MSVKFEVSETFEVPPEKLYNAWLNSSEHTEMTGGVANVSDEVDGEFDAWDGYITGRNTELVKGEKISQTWRTTEFAKEAPDSSLCILFETHGGGTKVTIYHDNLPEGGMRYKQGWVDYYFEPMKDYFM